MFFYTISASPGPHCAHRTKPAVLLQRHAEQHGLDPAKQSRFHQCKPPVQVQFDNPIQISVQNSIRLYNPVVSI
jgi:hypothetical protein